MLWWHARVASLGSEVIETNRNREDQTPCVSPTRSAGALLCLPRSLPNPSPRRRSQRGARAAQRARTTLTPTSGDPRSATRKALAAHPRSTGPPSDPQKAVTKRVQTPNPSLQPETHTPEGGSRL